MSLSTPSKVSVAFATNGNKNTIPDTTAVGDPTNKASYSIGFPSVTMTPKSAGGLPPFGRDMNGILYDITAEIQYRQAGGRYPFDSAFSTAIGGYSKGAVVQRADLLGSWVSQSNNNTTSPENSSTSWQPEGASSYSFTVSNSNVTLTNAQAAHPVLIVSGTLTANVVVTLPKFRKNWTVVDRTNHGTYSLSFKTSNGTGVSLSLPTEQLVCDGTNILRVGADPAAFIPTGMVVPFFGTTIPSGYLVANGSAVSRTLYANLFSVIGIRYGAGDGSTTFNLPNLIDRFVRYGTSAQLGTKVSDSIRSHSHSVTQSAHNHSVTQTPHTHTAGQASHTHTATQQTHSHTITQTPHTHTASQNAHTHSVTINPAGAHSHTRGSMDIKGTFPLDDDLFETQASQEAFTGAFEMTSTRAGGAPGDKDEGSYIVDFAASRKWTGSTSTQQNHTHTTTVGNAVPAINVGNANANISIANAQPSITVQNAQPSVTVNSSNANVSVNGATANISINNAGGTETAPMHIYAIPLIKV